MACPSLSFRSLHRLGVVVVCVAVGFAAGCTAPSPKTAAWSEDEPPAPHQLSNDHPSYLRLPNMAADRTPVRVGLILPLKDRSANTRQLAQAMLRAAELAVFDCGNPDIVLMTADESGPGENAANAAKKLLDQGAEVLIGPIFKDSVAQAGEQARDRGVPMLAFSTDRAVAGKGVYLLSYQSQNEVERIVAYVVGKGHRRIAALIPQTPYGEVVKQSFEAEAARRKADVVALQYYDPKVGAVNEQALAIAKSRPDAIFLPQSGSTLRAIVANLTYNGVEKDKTIYFGTGVWDDPANAREPLLIGGVFAAPQPSTDDVFKDNYRKTFHVHAQPLASLAYDAVLLVAHLSGGKPYHRFTRKSLVDARGFAGAGGIFRFVADGSIERGLAVLSVENGDFKVIGPAPTTFQTADEKPKKNDNPPYSNPNDLKLA